MAEKIRLPKKQMNRTYRKQNSIGSAGRRILSGIRKDDKNRNVVEGVVGILQQFEKSHNTKRIPKATELTQFICRNMQSMMHRILSASADELYDVNELIQTTIDEYFKNDKNKLPDDIDKIGQIISDSIQNALVEYDDALDKLGNGSSSETSDSDSETVEINNTPVENNQEKKVDEEVVENYEDYSHIDAEKLKDSLDNNHKNILKEQFNSTEYKKFLTKLKSEFISRKSAYSAVVNNSTSKSQTSDDKNTKVISSKNISSVSRTYSRNVTVKNDLKRISQIIGKNNITNKILSSGIKTIKTKGISSLSNDQILKVQKFVTDVTVPQLYKVINQHYNENDSSGSLGILKKTGYMFGSVIGKMITPLKSIGMFTWKLFKGVVKGVVGFIFHPIKTIKGMFNGIFNFLSKNTFMANLAKMFMNPAGGYLLGFFAGLLWTKIGDYIKYYIATPLYTAANNIIDAFGPEGTLRKNIIGPAKTKITQSAKLIKERIIDPIVDAYKETTMNNPFGWWKLVTGFLPERNKDIADDMLFFTKMYTAIQFGPAPVQGNWLSQLISGTINLTYNLLDDMFTGFSVSGKKKKITVDEQYNYLISDDNISKLKEKQEYKDLKQKDNAKFNSIMQQIDLVQGEKNEIEGLNTALDKIYITVMRDPVTNEFVEDFSSPYYQNLIDRVCTSMLLGLDKPVVIGYPDDDFMKRRQNESMYEYVKRQYDFLKGVLNKRTDNLKAMNVLLNNGRVDDIIKIMSRGNVKNLRSTSGTNQHGTIQYDYDGREIKNDKGIVTGFETAHETLTGTDEDQVSVGEITSDKVDYHPQKSKDIVYDTSNAEVISFNTPENKDTVQNTSGTHVNGQHPLNNDTTGTDNSNTQDLIPIKNDNKPEQPQSLVHSRVKEEPEEDLHFFNLDSFSWWNDDVGKLSHDELEAFLGIIKNNINEIKDKYDGHKISISDSGMTVYWTNNTDPVLLKTAINEAVLKARNKLVVLSLFKPDSSLMIRALKADTIKEGLEIIEYGKLNLLAAGRKVKFKNVEYMERFKKLFAANIGDKAETITDTNALIRYVYEQLDMSLKSSGAQTETLNEKQAHEEYVKELEAETNDIFRLLYSYGSDMSLINYALQNRPEFQGTLTHTWMLDGKKRVSHIGSYEDWKRIHLENRQSFDQLPPELRKKFEPKKYILESMWREREQRNSESEKRSLFNELLNGGYRY